MSRIFVNREEELKSLEEVYSSGKSALVIIYGRRRIGKTFLINFFARNRDSIYLIVNYEDRELALRDLTRQFLRQVKMPYKPLIESFADLYNLFPLSGARLIVIDEFQRLWGTGGVTELQSTWDSELSRKDIVLVLAGSAVGMIEKIGLSYEAPLYGRASKIIKLKELDYRSARVFMQNFSPVDKVRCYSIFGGIPGYLALIDDRASLMKNIENLVLKTGAPLREEPFNLLAMELREPSRYMKILEVMAEGATKLGEIADKAGIKVNEVGKYIRVLQKELDLIEKKYPLMEEGRKGKARYYIRDSFFQFWFKFIRPNIHLLELGLHKKVLNIIERKIDEHASIAFEKIALQHMALQAKKGKMSFNKIGKWWNGETEIDIVALDEKEKRVYFVEVKWTNKPVDKRVLYSLISKSENFKWKKRENIYIIYSKTGFTFKEEENVVLYSLKDIEKDFSEEKPLLKQLNIID
ncbi:MAG: hypothetical protein DRJ63_06545 [Thermoprotei archaeon]|nr:MAG: hypothetical protein DRJ63_06545 [Thermoprotei archaeon]